MNNSDANTPQEKIAKLIELAAPASPLRTTALPQVVVYGNGPVTVTSGDVHIHHHGWPGNAQPEITSDQE